MIEDAAHHLKKRRTSPSASPQRVHNSDDYSSDCCNLSFSPPPPSPPRLLLHTVRISSSSCSGNNNSLELGGGEEKKEDDYHNHHHAAISSKKAAHRSFSNISIVTALSALFVAPLLLWDDCPAKIEVLPFLRHIELIWVALLHISIWPVVVITAVISVVVASFAGGRHNRWGRIHHHHHYSPTSIGVSAVTSTTSTCHRLLCQPRSSLHYKLPLLLSLLMAGLISTQTFLQMAFPSAIWNPAVWTPWSYRVYLPTDLQKDLKGGCFSAVQGGGDFFDDNGDGATFRSNEVADKSVSSSSSTSLLRSSSSTTTANTNNNQPLCLSEQQWSHLSSGTLSSHNPTDVATVHRGLSYLQSQSKGIVINALARNIKNSIPDLRRNIEGLIPLLGRDTKLSFVVFENDSVDGTREELSRWAEEVNPAPTNNHGSSNSNNDDESRYNVDLIQCPPPNTNCKLNIIDRNDVYGGKNKTSSGVGKLGDFRQTVLDHIVQNYGTYSHMIVLDVDLGVSVSPLGILHTLGLMSEKSGDSLAEEYVVASAATQVWPGTFGTVAPPYDLSAFRPKPTSANLKVRTLQRQFCEMMPPGDRWRNMCDAASPMQLFMILKNNDPMYHHGRPYEVKSAFNGITMYPLGLIRERGMRAKYNAGKDGQQCEHIGFHLSLRDTMIVNPKWKMNLKVNKPGGPNGLRVSLKVFDAMSKRPNVTRVVGAMNFISLFVFVWAVWVLSVTVRESTIPSMIEFFKELRSRSETSFLYGYWLDVTGRGIESPSSSAAVVQQQQHRIVIEEEGKKYSS